MACIKKYIDEKAVKSGHYLTSGKKMINFY